MAAVEDRDADEAPGIGRFILLITGGVLAVVATALLLDALWLDGNTMALTYVGSFFSVALLTFLGFLFVARHVRRPAGTFEDGDVRFAITGTVFTLYLLLLVFFLFSPYRHNPPPFVQAWSDNMLVITSVVIGFYFATTGVTDYLRLREERRKGDAQGRATAEGTDGRGDRRRRAIPPATSSAAGRRTRTRRG